MAAQLIHPSAKIMQGVVLNGDITIGAKTYIGAGVIISANGGKIEIGDDTVIMENAIIRSTHKFGCKIGNNVLIGPKACITGSIVHDCCFIATNGTIFHGSELLSGTVLAVNSIIHIGTYCPVDTFVPINHIAFGNPVKIYPPDEILAFHAELRKTGFIQYVIDIDTTGLTNAETYKQLTAAALHTLNPG